MRLPHSVLLLLFVGCGAGPAPAGAPPVASSTPSVAQSASAVASSAPTNEPGPVASAPTLPASVGSGAPVRASLVPVTEPTTYVAPNKSVVLHGLTIAVEELTVKRTMEGGEVLRATVMLKAGGKSERQTLFSDAPSLAWHGYDVEMRGGSNEAAGFAVRKK